jgi:hypothetical protein
VRRKQPENLTPSWAKKKALRLGLLRLEVTSNKFHGISERWLSLGAKGAVVACLWAHPVIFSCILFAFRIPE